MILIIAFTFYNLHVELNISSPNLNIWPVLLNRMSCNVKREIVICFFLILEVFFVKRFNLELEGLIFNLKGLI